jgi:hypothetical protein
LVADQKAAGSSPARRTLRKPHERKETGAGQLPAPCLFVAIGCNFRRWRRWGRWNMR